MVDQIIDRKTVFLPGPQGKDGPQGLRGLPGVDALPADQAVAEYVAAPDSATASALQAWRPPVNVVDAGVDNTGTRDAAGQIQALADSSVSGLYFPAGVYLVSKPIVLPYATLAPWQVQMEPGALIRATRAMDEVLLLGGKSQSGPFNELASIRGGTIDCAYLASAGIRTSSKLTSVAFTDLTILNILDYGIYQERPDISFSLDSRYSNVRINLVHGPSSQGADSQATGVYLGGSDVQMSDIYISRVKTGIAAAGFFQISNSHLFTWGSVPPTTGIMAGGGLHAENLYLDGFQYGVSDQQPSGAFSVGVKIGLTLSNYFFYLYDGSPSDGNGFAPVRIHKSTPLTLLAHEFNYGSASGRGVVSYDDPATGRSTSRPTPYARTIMPARPQGWVPADDTESLLAASTRNWLQVIGPQNVPQGQGFLIGYAIWDTGTISMQSGITLCEDNAYTCARMWISLTLSNGSVSGSIRTMEAASPSPGKKLAIGRQIQLRDGLLGAPIYLYNSQTAGYWDGIYLTQWAPNLRQPTWFNSNKPPQAIDTSQIILTQPLA